MMKKSKRVIGMICLVVMLVSVFAVGVSAACTRGYSTHTIGVNDAFWFWQTDEAYASLTKCSCSPVDNDLMVWIRIQYKEGNNYYWTPSESAYYYSHEEDVGSVSRTISEKNITYVYAKYYATCGDMPQTSFDDEYNN